MSFYSDYNRPNQGPMPIRSYSTPVAPGVPHGAQKAANINNYMGWQASNPSPGRQMGPASNWGMGQSQESNSSGGSSVPGAGAAGYGWGINTGGATPAPNTSVWGQNAGNAPSHAAQVAQSQAAEQGFTAAGDPLKQYQSPGRSLDPGSQVLADQRNLGQFADTYAQIGAIPHQMSLQDATYNRAGQEINNASAYTQANALRQLQGAEYTAQNQRQNDVLTLLQSILG